MKDSFRTGFERKDRNIQAAFLTYEDETMNA